MNRIYLILVILIIITGIYLTSKNSSKETHNEGKTNNSPNYTSFETQPYFDIKNNYLQRLTDDINVVPIKFYDNFITEEECEQIKSLAKGKYTRSTVVANDDAKKRIDGRTSSTFYFERKANPIIEKIENKVIKLLNIGINQVEKIQITKYEKGQEYKPHYDYFDKNLINVPNQREHTIIIYLDNFAEHEGGATYFPLHKIRVYPVKGRVLHFKNLTNNDIEDQMMLHTGEPVFTDKPKHILTIWTRKNDM